MNPRPVQWFVTVRSQHGSISYDGHSENSSVWRGGAAYVQMCLTCGLEPRRDGYLSNCLCMCKRCSRALNGHGDAKRLCASCYGGRPEIASIATTEVKAKRKRAKLSPVAVVADAAVVAAVVADAAVVDVAVVAAEVACELVVASAATYVGYGHFRSCLHL